MTLRNVSLCGNFLFSYKQISLFYVSILGHGGAISRKDVRKIVVTRTKILYNGIKSVDITDQNREINQKSSISAETRQNTIQIGGDAL